MIDLQDEVLLKRIKDNDEEALKYLIKKYTSLINLHINKYLKNASSLGLDYNDLYQESLIAISHAAKTFDEKEKVLFKTYASLLIERQIKDLLKTNNRNSTVVLNEAYSLDDDINENNKNLYDRLPSTSYIPESYLAAKELDEEIKNVLTTLEYKVYELKKEGKSNKDIALILDMRVKAIENTFQRIKSKVRNIINKS